MRLHSIDNAKSPEEIIYTDDARMALEDSEGLVLCDNVQKFGKKAYLNRLQDAREMDKTVYISSYLYDWLGEENFYNNKVVVLNENDIVEKNFQASIPLLEVSCPIISILGIGENTDKFEVLLSIKTSLQNKGYKVLAISGNSNAKLLGCEVFPAYLYDHDISSTQKIMKINQYVYRLVEEYDPDIVLISYAGGITRLNEYENNFFGEISYVLSSAIESDYGVICTYYNKHYITEYFEELKQLCEIRFNVDILHFFISNQVCKTNTDVQRLNYDFYTTVLDKNSFFVNAQ